MLSNRCCAQEETSACKGDVQGKILHYKLCGCGLAANPRLQFCGWRGSLASIHELTWTENFRIRTPSLSVAGLVIFTKVVKIGGFFKFTALPLQDQTMHANESCHHRQHPCSSIGNCRELWNTLFSCRHMAGWIWPLAHIRHYRVLISTIASHEKGTLCSS